MPGGICLKDVSKKITYKDKEYTLVFNLNVMEEIQEKYGTLGKWGQLSDSKSGEPNAKAVIFGFTAMFNEGIDIDNEKNGTNIQPLTPKQVGRIITEVGMKEMTNVLNDTVIESTESAEKNA